MAKKQNADEVRTLIQKAGGYMKVAIACEVSETAPRRWAAENYIPEKCWSVFIETGADLKTLYAINERARKSGKV